MDALTILREFTVNQQLDAVSVTADARGGGRVKFGDRYDFDKDLPISVLSDNEGKPSTLEGLVYLAFHAGDMGKYARQCRDCGIPLMDIRARTLVKDYLIGVKDASADPLLLEAQQELLTAAPRITKRAREEATDEADALRLLLANERQLRDRNSMLRAPGADFTSLLQVYAGLVKAQEGAARKDRKKEPTGAPAAAAGGKAGHKTAPQQQQKPAASKPGPGAFIKASGRLERDTTKEQVRALGGNAGDMQQLGLGYSVAPAAAVPTAAAAAGSSGAPPPPPPPPSQPAAAKPPAPAAAAAGAAGQRSAQPQHKQQQQQQQRPRAAPGSTKEGERRHHSSKSGGGVPLILVPNATSAMFTMWNAKQFLEQGLFVPSEEARKAAGAAAKPPSLQFKRSAGRERPVTYELTDKVPAKGSADWKRVVAVIVMGKPWQFKDFPYRGADKGELVDTFAHHLGVFFYYKDEKVPDMVARSNVKVLPMERTARHLDMTVCLEFYKQLDGWLAARKCDLKY